MYSVVVSSGLWARTGVSEFAGRGPVGGPLDEHEQHHVEEQHRQEHDLRNELHVDADATLEVPEH